jgi:hypothetical protein
VVRTQVRFANPPGMRVTWYVPTQDGRTAPSPQYLETPGRYNFLQGAIYRLKLSDIPNRPGVELYPTLEVVPSGARACAFLSHSSVPVSFTEEDFEQVAAGNFVVKVIYLPDPQFQDLASTGPDEVVSSRLEPGVDPIAEAYRRGCILCIVRIGNGDLEAPNTPAMDSPGPGGMARGGMPQMGAPGMAGRMMPPGMMPQGMIPPNMMRPGMMPQGMMPPGMMMPPPGMMPPGMMPPGMMPPGMPPPGKAVPAQPVSDQPPPVRTMPTGPMGKVPGTASIRQASFVEGQ